MDGTNHIDPGDPQVELSDKDIADLESLGAPEDELPAPDLAQPQEVNIDVLRLAMVAVEPLVTELLEGRLNRDRRIELSKALSSIALADATRQQLMLNTRVIAQASGQAPSGLVVPR